MLGSVGSPRDRTRRPHSLQRGVWSRSVTDADRTGFPRDPAVAPLVDRWVERWLLFGLSPPAVEPGSCRPIGTASADVTTDDGRGGRNMSTAPSDGTGTAGWANRTGIVPLGTRRPGVPRRPGVVGARFIDRATSLPNRVSFITELDFALQNHPHFVAVVLLYVEPGPVAPPTRSWRAGDDDEVEVVLAATDRLRTAVRPSDMVARVGPRELAAALWSLDSPSVGSMVFDRVERAIEGPLATPPRGLPYKVVPGFGVAPSGVTGNEALAIAWASLEAAKLRRGIARRSA